MWDALKGCDVNMQESYVKATFDEFKKQFRATFKRYQLLFQKKFKKFCCLTWWTEQFMFTVLSPKDIRYSHLNCCVLKFLRVNTHDEVTCMVNKLNQVGTARRTLRSGKVLSEWWIMMNGTNLFRCVFLKFLMIAIGLHLSSDTAIDKTHDTFELNLLCYEDLLGVGNRISAIPQDKPPSAINPPLVKEIQIINLT